LGDITARQDFVVKTTLELGFFNFQKRVNLRGLSKWISASYVTLSGILRCAEKNISRPSSKKREIIKLVDHAGC